MHILLINQFYRPDVAATAQLLTDLAEELAQQGHEVDVVCSRSKYSGGTERFTKEEILGNVRIHRIAATGFGNSKRIGHLVDWLSFFFSASWKVVRLPRMDLCVVLTTPPFIGYAAILLKWLKKTPFVLWSMDIYPDIAVATGVIKRGKVLDRLFSRLARKLYHKASCIISLGEVMTQRLIEKGADPGKIKAIHNWVPGESVEFKTPDLSSLRKQWKLNNRVTLMYSGNLGMGFDLETFASAMGMLGSIENLSIVFVGNGIKHTQLCNLLEKNGLCNVAYSLPVPLAQLSDSLAAGDIHIVSQKPGTQGLIVPSKLYGIMAAGRPAIFIGPRDSECSQIIRKSGAGIIVLPGNANGLAEAIKSLANNPELRAEMGKRGRKYYEQHFGRDRSVFRIIKAVEDTKSPKLRANYEAIRHTDGKL